MVAKTEQTVVEKWEVKMGIAGHQFAQLRTVKAIYDRVAVVAKFSTMITIQFPKGTSRNKNLKPIHTPSDSFTIVQKNIAKRDIVNIRYYKN